MNILYAEQPCSMKEQFTYMKEVKLLATSYYCQTDTATNVPEASKQRGGCGYD
jgi:hypothetical protein